MYKADACRETLFPVGRRENYSKSWSNDRRKVSKVAQKQVIHQKWK